MFVHYRTRGFVIKKEDRGEANQLFKIYTKDLGKLEVLGKAIRKISSKLRSGIDLFSLSEIEFIQGKAYKTLTDAILIEKFDKIKQDLKKLKITHEISEVLNSLVSFQEPDEKIWQLLNETLARLNKLELKIENWKLKITYYYFLWNLLSLLGFQPELYNCILCQKKLEPEKNYFNSKEGGVICQVCSKKTKLGKEISAEAIKILRIILKRNWQTLSKLKMDQTYFKSIKDISEDYLSSIKSNYAK